MQYSILDPTGNITALVENNISINEQPACAAEIMNRHPDVEQVGFIRFPSSERTLFQVELRMAGGEFCGNASMCAAALYLHQNDMNDYNNPVMVQLRVSGSSKPIFVTIHKHTKNLFETEILMPNPLEINETDFVFDQYRGNLPVVRLEGISHIIIEPESVFFNLLSRRSSAEKAVKKWCKNLTSCGLGMMFLERKEKSLKLTPLVYIPKSDTLFWENSCASGSSAVGAYIAQKMNEPLSLILDEPGGQQKITCDPNNNTVMLSGQVKIRAQYNF